jgi:hypothetical protein
MVEMSARSNVSFQILPFAALPGLALGGSFSVLNFAEPVMPDVVFVEGPLGEIYQTKSQDVERCSRLFDRLASLALDENRSIELVNRWIDRLH